MTVELACSQQSRNRHSLRFREAKPVLIFTDADVAAIFVKATNGTSPLMANLTNLAKWRADGTISSDEELRSLWLRL